MKIRSAYAQCAMKFVPRMLSINLHVKTVYILPLAEHARKVVPRMLSVRCNRFLVCSVCDKIVSAYAQHAHAIINFFGYQSKKFGSAYAQSPRKCSNFEILAKGI